VLEKRLQTLESIEEIRKLKAAYCKACDNDHNPKEVVALFDDDGIWEASGIGKYKGITEIQNYMADLRASGRIKNSAHNVFNPSIDVEGDRATGHWRLLMLYTANTANSILEYYRIIGWYREKYIRTRDGWKFKHLYCQIEEHSQYLINHSEKLK